MPIGVKTSGVVMNLSGAGLAQHLMHYPPIAALLRQCYEAIPLEKQQ